MIELRRQDLRREGHDAEADDPDLTVTVLTDNLRSLFSTFHDHHEFVGKVLELEEFVTASGLQG